MGPGDLIIRDNVLETDQGGLVYAIALGGDITVTGNTAKGFGIGLFGYFGHTAIQDNYVESLRPIRNTLRISEDSFGRHHPSRSRQEGPGGKAIGNALQRSSARTRW